MEAKYANAWAENSLIYPVAEVAENEEFAQPPIIDWGGIPQIPQTPLPVTYNARSFQRTRSLKPISATRGNRRKAQIASLLVRSYPSVLRY